jgi:hypothetical protein
MILQRVSDVPFFERTINFSKGKAIPNATGGNPTEISQVNMFHPFSPTKTTGHI